MFHPGLTNVEPRQRCDSFSSVPPIGEALYLNSSAPPTPNDVKHHIPPFTPRRPLTQVERNANKRSRRKIRFTAIMSKRPPPDAPSPRCARFRIAAKEARKHRKIVTAIARLTKMIESLSVRMEERILVHFNLAANIHNLSTSLSPLPVRPLKRQRSPSPPTSFLHTASLRRSPDRPLIARTLKRHPRLLHKIRTLHRPP